MKYVYLVLNWAFGVFFLSFGLYLLLESPLGGLSLILISLLLLPPVRNFVYSKINKELSVAYRGAAIFLLFLAFGSFVGESQDIKERKSAAIETQEIAQMAAARRKQDIDYFNQNMLQILSEINESFQEGNYKQVILVSSKYLPSQNQELIELNAKAKSELAIIERAEKEAEVRAERKIMTREILAKLRTIPGSEYGQNRHFYQELVTYNPDNEKYKEKLNYYSAKFKEQQEKARVQRTQQEQERAVRLAMFGEPPKPSGWDGSYHEVKSYLKRAANDPDSIEIDRCTNVYHTKNGWLVGCDYRGRNAFGGMIRQSNWFSIVHGTVVEMHDASAYNP